MENAVKIAHSSHTHEKVNKTDSFQPSGCNGTPVYVNLISVCSTQLFCEHRRNILANEVPSERYFLFFFQGAWQRMRLYF